MKKLIFIIVIALSAVCATAQTSTGKTSLSIASGLDSLNYPIYDNIYKMDKYADFYVIPAYNKPIQCNMMRVYTYYRDYTNGKKANNYWVYQGYFDFTVYPYYMKYSLPMKAFKVGQYKVAVSGYLNGTYQKDFGTTTFSVKNYTGLTGLDLQFLDELFDD